MKQKDIAVVVVVAFLSAILSFVISGKIFVTPENRQQAVEKVDVIKPDFDQPDSRYFNADSINPTVNPTPGSGGTNQNPFNGTGQ